MSLKARLKAEIRAGGPMTVARFMDACLHDPKDGYYASRPRLGEAGDFVTAPLVSQMFGELIGAWMVAVWRDLGAPSRVLLVEAGPGDGTLMSDILRVAALDPAFLAAAELWLVETSQPLVELQRQRLAGAGAPPRWVASLDALPGDAPAILVANELLDCLPARQFVRLEDGWAERAVGLDDRSELAFGLAPCAPGFAPTPQAVPPGAVIEVSQGQAVFAAALGARVASQGGAALLIDYGRAGFETGDTLQALRGHQKVDPLACPGEADLTVHADFPAVRAAAEAQGCATALLSQGEFLRRLGVESRAEALARAHPDKAATLARQLDRLTAADQMGALFKVVCLYPRRDAPPPGFHEDAHGPA